MTSEGAVVAARPATPRRAVSMAVPLIVAIAIGGIGARFGHVAAGALWGLVAAGGVLLALWLGRVTVTTIERSAIAVGLAASTILATRVLPFAPETVDVLLCVKFAAAWIPAGLACAFVAHRHGASPASVFNTALMWLVAGAFSVPVAEVLDVLRPLDSLRRNQEPIWGVAEYVIIGLVVGAIAVGAFLAVTTRLPALGTVAAVITFTVFAGAAVGFSFGDLFTNLGNITNVPNVWPPAWDWAIGEGTWWWVPSWEFGDPFTNNPFVETIRIAITATVFGCVIALPIAFMASTLTAPNHVVYLIDKGFLNIIRTIPDLFWAMILTASIGFGPFAGALALIVFSMSIMAKLLSETVDAADPGPLEAAKAAGGSHFPAVRTSVLPQVMPNYAALSMYIFELNIRASAILGIVGAGGIGRVIEAQRITANYDRVVAVLIPIFVVVIIVEQISVFVRRRLT